VRVWHEHHHKHDKHDDHDDARLGCVLLRHREPVAKGVFQRHDSWTMLWFVLSRKDVFRDQLQHNDHEHDHDHEYHHEHDGTANRSLLRYQRSRYFASVCGADSGRVLGEVERAEYLAGRRHVMQSGSLPAVWVLL
jgi:hypothetical protein